MRRNLQLLHRGLVVDRGSQDVYLMKSLRGNVNLLHSSHVGHQFFRSLVELNRKKFLESLKKHQDASVARRIALSILNSVCDKGRGKVFVMTEQEQPLVLSSSSLTPKNNDRKEEWKQVEGEEARGLIFQAMKTMYMDDSINDNDNDNDNDNEVTTQPPTNNDASPLHVLASASSSPTMTTQPKRRMIHQHDALLAPKRITMDVGGRRSDRRKRTRLDHHHHHVSAPTSPTTTTTTATTTATRDQPSVLTMRQMMLSQQQAQADLHRHFSDPSMGSTTTTMATTFLPSTKNHQPPTLLPMNNGLVEAMSLHHHSPNLRLSPSMMLAAPSHHPQQQQRGACGFGSVVTTQHQRGEQFLNLNPTPPAATPTALVGAAAASNGILADTQLSRVRQQQQRNMMAEASDRETTSTAVDDGAYVPAVQVNDVLCGGGPNDGALLLPHVGNQRFLKAIDFKLQDFTSSDKMGKMRIAEMVAALVQESVPRGRFLVSGSTGFWYELQDEKVLVKAMRTFQSRFLQQGQQQQQQLAPFMSAATELPQQQPFARPTPSTNSAIENTMMTTMTTTTEAIHQHSPVYNQKRNQLSQELEALNQRRIVIEEMLRVNQL